MPETKEPGPLASHWLSMEEFFRTRGRSDLEIVIFRLAFYSGAHFVLSNARTAMSLLLMASEMREFEREVGLEAIGKVKNEVVS
jgi:hypothetical protein